MFIHLSFNWCLSYKSIVCNLNAYIFFRVHASYIFVFPFWKRPPFSGFVAQSPDDRVKVIITIQGKEWGVASSPFTILPAVWGGTSGWPQSPETSNIRLHVVLVSGEAHSPPCYSIILIWKTFWKINIQYAVWVQVSLRYLIAQQFFYSPAVLTLHIVSRPRVGLCPVLVHFGSSKI